MSRPGTGEPIGVVVIGGYLGSGKTTLVNHVLRVGTGRRTMVLVNDFGAVSVDDALIESHADGVVALVNGCVCCSLTGSLVDAMQSIRSSERPPELLLIEGSGVADPGPLSHHATMPGFRLDGVVVVVDAETIRRRAADSLVGPTVLRQLRAADLLVVNKTDLVERSALERLHEWLSQQAPDATVVDTTRAEVPVALLGGITPGLEERATEPHDAHDELHHTWAWRGTSLLDRDALARLLDELPDGVVRAKGVVRLIDDPQRATVVQLVGRRWTMERGGEWPDGGDSRLVVIGIAGSVHADALDAAMGRAVR